MTIAPQVGSINSTIDRATVAGLRFPAWLRGGMRVATIVAPGSAASITQRLFFTPPTARIRPAEQAVLDRAEAYSVDSAGGRVAAYSWGAGPLVLLVHGWGGYAGHLSALVDPLVAAGFRAVAIDLPGHGRSAGKRSSLVHAAAAIEATAATFGSPHGLVAHSFGAAAGTYALSRGLPVDRVVYFAPSAQFEPIWRGFGSALGVSEAVMRRMQRKAEARLGVAFEEIEPYRIAPAMTAPLLVVHSLDDRQLPYEEGVTLVARWPGALLRSVEGLGHMRILRHTSCIADAVDFLIPAHDRQIRPAMVV